MIRKHGTGVITATGTTGRPIRRDHHKPLSEQKIRERLKYLQKTPRKIGDGSALFSLSLAVERQPFRWDTNSFYRRLNLEPLCDRIDIVSAYQDSPRHTEKANLYYATAMKALLKKDSRRVYDAIHLGAFFADDPDLDEARNPIDLDEALVPTSLTEWAVYADPCVSDSDAKGWDSSELRHGIVKMLSNWGSRFDDPRIGLGVTRTEPRWEMIGNFPILFVGLDEDVTMEYLVRVANAFMAATETKINS